MAIRSAPRSVSGSGISVESFLTALADPERAQRELETFAARKTAAEQAEAAALATKNAAAKEVAKAGKLKAEAEALMKDARHAEERVALQQRSANDQREVADNNLRAAKAAQSAVEQRARELESQLAKIDDALAGIRKLRNG